MKFNEVRQAMMDGEKIAREYWQKGTDTLFYIQIDTKNKSKDIEQQLLILYMKKDNEEHDICTWSLSSDDLTGTDWYILKDKKDTYYETSSIYDGYKPGWICPKCLTVYAPEVLTCSCLKNSNDDTNTVCKDHIWIFEACVGMSTTHSTNRYKCTKCGKRKDENEYYKDKKQNSINYTTTNGSSYVMSQFTGGVLPFE